MWTETNDRLTIHLSFRDFAEAMGFIQEVALRAERMDHHPTWTNSWNKVSIELCTHSAGNKITEKDRKLALEIEEIYRKYRI